MSASGSAPTLSRRARSATASTRPSAAEPTATTTDTAMQRSPAEPNPADTAASAATPRSASGSTTMWFLAPPRACTRLAFADAVRWMWRATGVEPTKLTAAMSGCSSSRSTASASPLTTLNTPGSKPASAISSAMNSAADGVFSLGLCTKALPQARAVGIIHSGTMAGKLNGVIPATTPSGRRIVVTSIPEETSLLWLPRSSSPTLQAYSMLSSPRATSPRASSWSLPCSAEIRRASSSALAATRLRSPNISLVRVATLDAPQACWARTAAATASSTTSAEARATAPVWSPVAGL